MSSFQAPGSQGIYRQSWKSEGKPRSRDDSGKHMLHKPWDPQRLTSIPSFSSRIENIEIDVGVWISVAAGIRGGTIWTCLVLLERGGDLIWYKQLWNLFQTMTRMFSIERRGWFEYRKIFDQMSVTFTRQYCKLSPCLVHAQNQEYHTLSVRHVKWLKSTTCEEPSRNFLDAGEDYCGI